MKRYDTMLLVFQVVVFLALFLLLSFLLFGCVGVNTVSVNGVSTGWYDQDGRIVTTSHGLGDSVEIKSPTGFTDNAVKVEEVEEVAIDVAKYSPTVFYKERRCYTSVVKGDRVTVSTNRGPIRRRIISVESTVVYLSGSLIEGDSGAPVTRGRCIIGIVRANTSEGVLVVKI